MLALLATAGLLAGEAQAAPATPEEARRLTGVFESYVGRGPADTPSPVTVVPHGDSYTATLDVTRLLGFLSAMGLDVTAGDLTAELTPQPDGLWHVAVDGFPPVGVVQDGQTSAISLNGYRFDGVFDPALQAFARSTTASTGAIAHARGPKGAADVTVADKGTGSSKATDAGDGTVDLTIASEARDIDYRVTTLPDAGGQTAAVEMGHLTVAALTGTTSIARHPAAAIGDLWRFLVAHPSRAALVADQPALKAKLLAVLPLATAVTGELHLSKLAVDTRLGAFGLDSFSEAYGSAGSDTNAISVRAAGLTLPEGLVPRWAVPLVPMSIDLAQNNGSIALTPALRKAIDMMDLSVDPPLTDAQRAELLKMLRSDAMTVRIAPSSIVTPTMTLKFEGETRLTQPLPEGAATVAVVGLDKTIEAVRAAAPDDPSAAMPSCC